MCERMSGVSYKRNKPDGAWDAIVIGSGMGGPSSAALLAREAGLRVLVLERHYTAGGFTHVFRRPGFEWDVGLHYVGGIEGRDGIGLLFDRVTGGLVKWARMPECYDRIVLGEESFDLVSGKERFVDTLAQRFVGQRQDIERYLALSRRATRAGMPYFIDKLLSQRAGRFVGPLLRAPFLRYSDRTVEDVLRPVIRDPKLFDVLTGLCGDYGLTPREASFGVHAMVALHYLEGAYYPIGGPAGLARGAESVIAAAGGGEIYTNAEVREILLRNGRAAGVRMSDGREILAPIVISDAGVRPTLERLLPTGTCDDLLPPVEKVGPSIAHLCLHLGFEHTDAELGLDGTNLWIYAPGDREEAFRRFADNPDAPLPVTYISFPSAKDPSFATRYPGKATVEVITLAKMSWFERWRETRWMKRGDAYDEFKANLSERLLDVLFAHRPQLRGKVVYQELSTPLSTKHFTAHDAGEMYGLAHTPERFRLPIRAQSPIDGLYFTGADLVSCGVAGALFGGAITAGTVLKDRLPSLVRRRVFGGIERRVRRSPEPAASKERRAEV